MPPVRLHMLASIKRYTRQLKKQTMVVYFAARDKRTPTLVRLLAVAIAAYALSPIDLIPDFVPVLGYLDDIILIPLGIAIVVRLIPPLVLAYARLKAEEVDKRPTSFPGAAMIVLIWLLALALFASWIYRKVIG